MKYIVQGQKHISGYKYDIKDGFTSLADARNYRNDLRNGIATMPGGYIPDTRDTFFIAQYEKRSYEAMFVE
mgnify:CR=1 FL=1